MYMTTNVGKDEFCTEWEKGLKDSTTAHAMAALVEYNSNRADDESLMRKDAEQEIKGLSIENKELQETINNLHMRVKDMDDEAAEKDGRILKLEERIEKLEAEKTTLYKLIEKLLDK